MWTYEVAVAPGGGELAVDATLAAGAGSELSVDDGAEPFVRDVQLEQAGEWKPVKPRGTSWFVAACARGCRLRYRFELRRAADALGTEVAMRLGEAIEAPPESWLLHPINSAQRGTFRFHVTTPPGQSFASGVHLWPGAAGTYQADVLDLPDAPYSVFGALRIERLQSHGGQLELAFVPLKRALTDDQVRDWIRSAADAVGSYYQRFPIERVLIIVAAQSGQDSHGRTLGNGGATILFYVGEERTHAELGQDWVLVHELTHLAFPSMPRGLTWIEEGLATYVEPLERVRLGQLAPEVLWGELVSGLPKGLPASGDRGLDRTHTWGRIYWGGALFCFLADLELREKSGNRKSLDDALRGIVAQGGNISVRWTLDEALAAGDRATGLPVLVPLHKKMGSAPMEVDLDAAFRRLGVRVEGGHVRFDDSAPLANLRRSITTGTTGTTGTPAR